MKCPKCGLINPETALRCDCGYDFATHSVKQSYIEKKPLQARLPHLWIGFAMAALFLVAEFVVAVRKDLDWVLIVVTLIAWFYWLFCVYKFHDVMENIPGWEHPISSNRAVAMHFIPLYNFYWVFKWPKEVATFVNWRTQSQSMKGRLVGLAVLLAVLVFRSLDGFIGLLILFGCGVYISRCITKALGSPPVPLSAMAPAGVRGPLGL
jgi:hypothetical protein